MRTAGCQVQPGVRAILVESSASNPKHEMATTGERIRGPSKELFKLTDRTRCDDVRKNGFRANLLKSFGANLDIAEIQAFLPPRIEMRISSYWTQSK